jgi:hypothetical protein
MRTKRGFLPAFLLVGAVAAAVFGVYLVAVLHSRYADDYHYFFDINALAEVEWKNTATWVGQLLHHGLWVDRILYPAGLAVLLLSFVWLRPLWRNPLFTASWIAVAGQAIFILRRQDDYAPRYFLAMLVPLILIVVVAFQELRTRHRPMATLLAAALAITVLVDSSQIVRFLAHRQYQYDDAAQAIAGIVRADPHAHPMMLGSSGDQLSLMAHIPSLNDGYSLEDLGEKTAHYQPGWYIGWNELDQDILDSLATYRLEKVATYRVFDHDERDLLTLYRMVPAKP